MRQNTISFELNYGLWRNLEIGVEAPLITIVNARDPSVAERIVTGIGDTNFSAKYNFRREREDSKLPAMTVTFNLEVPTGDVDRQLGSGLADYALNSVFQKSLGAKTVLRANGGIIFSGNTVTGAIGIRARGTVLTGGASLVRQFAPRLYLGAEVAGAFTRNLDLSKGQIQAQVGGNYTLRENLSLDFGVIAGRDASPRLGAQVGISLDF